ncbi:CopG family transcriptional regulator [uncultured Jatrophihabitans sp.]|uniref:ribbon-helix-helix domain-containing protein n=1 Tax=uncultured Jatrophihabitans sp. TaxID=1610747 RepID=UPI0035CC494E
MQRTQISLTADDRLILDAEATRSGRSIAALIRAAVRSTYGEQRPVEDDLATMRSAFGSWAEHDDGAIMVDRLRSGSRLVRE